MNEKHCYFDFCGETVRLTSDSQDLIVRLEKDFSYFKRSEFSPAKFIVEARLEAAPNGVVPSAVADKQSLQSLTFDQGEIRVNDYYGKLVSRYDYKNEKAQLWSKDIEKLHEVTYLLILSRIGKALDLHGLHKVHAMAFSKNDVCVVGMMPMKGGKSTLLANILRDQSVSIVSDDCPLVNRDGVIEPFPLRLGVDELSVQVGLKNSEVNSYKLIRDFYGEKNLISLEGLPHEIGRVGARQILFVGRRAPGMKPVLHRVSKISMIKPLLYNMVIGIGLPMMMEYFWENGFNDFLKKSYIALSRAWSAIRLLERSDCYQFWMSENPEENAKFLLSQLEQK